MQWLLIVPGPSDELFWKGLLRRGLLPQVSSIKQAGGDDRMIRDAGEHLAQGRRIGATPLFLPDLDTHPCVDSLRQSFQARSTGAQIVAVRRAIEAWYLADEDAIRSLLPKVNWNCRGSTDALQSPKQVLADLYRRHHAPKARSYTPREFAGRMGPIFVPQRAAQHSASLRRFLDLVSQEPNR